MKKIIAIALGLCVMLGLCSCSGNASETQRESVEPRAAEVDLDAIVEAVEKELPEEGFKPEIGIVLGRPSRTKLYRASPIRLSQGMKGNTYWVIWKAYP